MPRLLGDAPYASVGSARPSQLALKPGVFGAPRAISADARRRDRNAAPQPRDTRRSGSRQPQSYESWKASPGSIPRLVSSAIITTPDRPPTSTYAGD